MKRGETNGIRGQCALEAAKKPSAVRRARAPREWRTLGRLRLGLRKREERRTPDFSSLRAILASTAPRRRAEKSGVRRFDSSRHATIVLYSSGEQLWQPYSRRESLLRSLLKRSRRDRDVGRPATTRERDADGETNHRVTNHTNSRGVNPKHTRLSLGRFTRATKRPSRASSFRRGRIGTTSRLRRFTGTACGSAPRRVLRTPLWRATSAGTTPATPGSIRRSTC